jgi:NADH:ubiquinone oxidoreductase subunit 6 (subunit J)
MLNIIIFSIVVCSAIISSLSVVLSQNPVYSVIALVLVFFNFSCLSIMLGLEFIPINLLVIYCGAIAILFLFVILTLNIKIAELNKQNFELLPACVFLVVAFLILCFISLHSNFIPLFIFEQTNFMFLIDFTKHLSITSTEFES